MTDRDRQAVHLDKIQGSLMGGAIGDALGYPVEFMSLNSIVQQYGSEGISAYKLNDFTKTALISDDTQMTLFTAAGLLAGAVDVGMEKLSERASDYVFCAYLNWMETQGYTVDKSHKLSWLSEVSDLYACRAPGNTCLSALQGRTVESSYATIAHPVNNSKGCGGVMRVAPIGLLFDKLSAQKVGAIAADIAAITHSHPLGYIPAAIMAHMIHTLVYGNGDLPTAIANALASAEEQYKNVPDMALMKSLLQQAVEFTVNDRSDAENIQILGQGWVAEEALAVAVYCALKYQDDFSKAMIAAVNHDGDSDSTGAITGNVLGALLGYRAIPECWKTDLELKDVILEIGEDLSIAHEGKGLARLSLKYCPPK